MKFKFSELKSFAAAMMAILGITEWSKDAEGHQTLIDEQVAKLKESGFSDDFMADFSAALKANFEDGAGAQAQEDGNMANAVLKAQLSTMTARLAKATAENNELKAAQAAGAQTADAIKAKDALIASLEEKIRVLGKVAEQDPGAGAQSAGATAPGLDYQNEQQLFGLEGQRFAMDRAYNRRARAAMMAMHGYEVSLPKASSVDFKTLRDDLGEYYNVRYQDRLQSFLMQLPSIQSIMPLEAGYQDLETIVNLFLGEFSQADNSDESDFQDVVKGKYEFEPETIKMFDVMFAHTFKSLKKLEKSWIGYLNREASNPIKLSLIEYLLQETVKQLHNEQEQRRVNGVRKEPVKGKPGRSINAADGLYEYIRKRVDGYQDYITGKTIYQIKPFQLGEITPENIGDVIKKGTEQIPAVIRDSGMCVLMLPSLLVSWYAEWRAANKGLMTGYTGGENGKQGLDAVLEYPSVKIQVVRNADAHRRLIWTMDGNFRLFCQKQGEMLDFNLEQEDWKLKVWSNWKEGLAAIMVGRKQTTKENTDYGQQMIFVNEIDMPATFFVDAEPDQNPSALQHTSIKTVANTTALTITDIADAEVGKVITLMCGSTEKGVTIAKSGVFSLLTAAWTPAQGDMIKLMKRADGKFIEIMRANSASAALQFEANDTAPSVEGGTTFVVGTNSQATALTTLADAVVGTVYTIYGKGSTNATTIANSGNFALTAAMTLSEGKMIKLVAIEGGKFAEISRA